jgi:hypothetical protein
LRFRKPALSKVEWEESAFVRHFLSAEGAEPESQHVSAGKGESAGWPESRRDGTI